MRARRLNPRLGIGQKFSAVLGVLVPVILVVALIGVRGIAEMREELDAVHGHVLPSLVEAREAQRGFSHAESVALLLIPLNDKPAQEALRREFGREIRPSMKQALARLRDRHSGRRAAMTEVQALVEAWNDLSVLERSGSLYLIGDDERYIRINARLIDSVTEIAADADAALQRLWEIEVDEQRAIASRAQDRYEDVVIRLMVVVGFGLLIAVGAILWLTRDVVTRVKRYSRFATRIAEGELSTRLEPSGRDELSDLGRRLDEMVARSAAVRQHEEAQIEFARALQVAESEEDAHGLLKRQLERSIGGASVVILRRNNGENRLEAATPVPDDSCLLPGLLCAEPRSCPAIRTGTMQETGDGDSLVKCELCSAAAGRATCRPLMVGSEVMGSVLVEHEHPLSGDEAHAFRDSVTQAAPVLANLRNLAIAEIRAATDALTGLSNARSGHEAVGRMTAHASRTGTPLAAAMIDLDHFKQINDEYGHASGDDVLAAVGVAMRSCVRERDFVARYGGEEFMALFPETDAEGALVVAEKIRATIEELTVPAVKRAITASVGIAVLPDHAGESDSLLRNADRALYSAKRAGRNRVHTFSADDDPGPVGQGWEELAPGA